MVNCSVATIGLSTLFFKIQPGRWLAFYTPTVPGYILMVKALKGCWYLMNRGRYAIQILKAVRSKVASGDKNKCTPEEYAALVQGSNAHFGQYTVDQAANTITFHIEHASFPNWEGTQQQRSCTYTGRELKYVVTQTTQGGVSVVAEVAWRRL